MLGDEDRLARGERAIAAAPKMEVRTLEDTGHFPLWRRPTRFLRELRDVLAIYAR